MFLCMFRYGKKIGKEFSKNEMLMSASCCSHILVDTTATFVEDS